MAGAGVVKNAAIEHEPAWQSSSLLNTSATAHARCCMTTFSLFFAAVDSSRCILSASKSSEALEEGKSTGSGSECR